MGDVKMQFQAAITAIGSYVPERKLTNVDLEKMVQTNDEWIVRRTGIKERRVIGEVEHTSDLCCKAAHNLAKRYSLHLDDVDMVLVCTLTPDFKTPSTASIVQYKLGIPSCGAIDLNAACAGFTYGLYMANALVTAGLNKKVLVIGAESLTSITDFTDRTTAILFGDGAGAVLVEKSSESSFLECEVGSQGQYGKHLYSTNLASDWEGTPLTSNGKIVQNGREVYKWAVTEVPKGIERLVRKADAQMENIDWFIPHSANLRMIEAICQRSGIAIERTLYSMEYYGNTSSASIPLALDTAVRNGKVSNNDLLLLYGFGGGLAYAGLLVNWQGSLY